MVKTGGRMNILRLIFFLALIWDVTDAPGTVVCHAGTHLSADGRSCLPCPIETFMPDNNHTERKCYDTTKIINPKLEITIKEYNSTHDRDIQCVDGYFRQRETDPAKIDYCEECSPACPSGFSRVHACQNYTNIGCCEGDSPHYVIRDGFLACDDVDNSEERDKLIKKIQDLESNNAKLIAAVESLSQKHAELTAEVKSLSQKHECGVDVSTVVLWVLIGLVVIRRIIVFLLKLCPGPGQRFWQRLVQEISRRKITAPDDVESPLLGGIEELIAEMKNLIKKYDHKSNPGSLEQEVTPALTTNRLKQKRPHQNLPQTMANILPSHRPLQNIQTDNPQHDEKSNPGSLEQEVTPALTTNRIKQEGSGATDGEPSTVTANETNENSNPGSLEQEEMPALTTNRLRKKGSGATDGELSTVTANETKDTEYELNQM